MCTNSMVTGLGDQRGVEAPHNAVHETAAAALPEGPLLVRRRDLPCR